MSGAGEYTVSVWCRWVNLGAGATPDGDMGSFGVLQLDSSRRFFQSKGRGADCGDGSEGWTFNSQSGEIDPRAAFLQITLGRSFPENHELGHTTAVVLYDDVTLNVRDVLRITTTPTATSVPASTSIATPPVTPTTRIVAGPELAYRDLPQSNIQLAGDVNVYTFEGRAGDVALAVGTETGDEIQLQLAGGGL